MIMIIIVSLVTGTLLGFATSARTPTDGIEDLTRNIVIGIVGAFLGLQFASGMFDFAETGASAITQIVAAIIGASILLFCVNRIRKT